MKYNIDALIKEYQGRVYAYSYSLLLDRSEALDNTQEVFEKALGQAGFLAEDFPHLPWLLRVTRNQAFNRRRSVSRCLAWLKRTLMDTSTADRGFLELEELEIKGEVQRLLGRIDLADRDLLIRRFYLDQTFDEIAKDLSRPRGTVLARYHRLMKRLKPIAIEEGLSWTECSQN